MAQVDLTFFVLAVSTIVLTRVFIKLAVPALKRVYRRARFAVRIQSVAPVSAPTPTAAHNWDR